MATRAIKYSTKEAVAEAEEEVIIIISIGEIVPMTNIFRVFPMKVVIIVEEVGTRNKKGIKNMAETMKKVPEITITTISKAQITIATIIKVQITISIISKDQC